MMTCIRTSRTLSLETTNMTGNSPLATKVPSWVSQLFPLRVFAEHDSAHGFYVAHCLETGSVTSGEDMETVLDMIERTP